MPWIVGGAILGSALIGGVSSYAGGQAQSGAANHAADLQNQQYQQTRQDLAPWRQVGQGALYQINDLMGLGGTNAFANPAGGNAFAQQQQSVTPGVAAAMGMNSSGGSSLAGMLGGVVFSHLGHGRAYIKDIADALQNGRPVTDADWAKAGYGPGGTLPGQTPGAAAPGALASNAPAPAIDAAAAQQNAFAKFRTDPGYQFAFDQGQKALQNSAAARGILNSGATAKALTNYGQGMADQQYGTYYNRLASLAGIGQTATNQTANYGANAANNAGNAFMAAGNARASAYGGMAGAANQGIQNYLTYQGQRPAYNDMTGGYYNGSYLAPYNSPAAAMGW